MRIYAVGLPIVLSQHNANKFTITFRHRLAIADKRLADSFVAIANSSGRLHIRGKLFASLGASLERASARNKLFSSSSSWNGRSGGWQPAQLFSPARSRRWKSATRAEIKLKSYFSIEFERERRPGSRVDTWMRHCVVPKDKKSAIEGINWKPTSSAVKCHFIHCLSPPFDRCPNKCWNVRDIKFQFTVKSMSDPSLLLRYRLAAIGRRPRPGRGREIFMMIWCANGEHLVSRCLFISLRSVVDRGRVLLWCVVVLCVERKVWEKRISQFYKILL